MQDDTDYEYKLIGTSELHQYNELHPALVFELCTLLSSAQPKYTTVQYIPLDIMRLNVHLWILYVQCESSWVQTGCGTQKICLWTVRTRLW